ncbi:hypothetical protein HMPREF9318_01069 [Streptococcus urinalis FB127-CNA-2]|uniref:Uncharacterized protein n=1 Tax=Streptococcus urinalis 2285-97 TaxID=764291 RepID=G5KHL2_9STRE|nr:hypothetical protein [Streptococcus urinalis]EHJ57406.1 hypothetical protein STRUR_0225 [Streptococcus urinalis 2285-97]EKS21115.1 hypothetical protein HMPREF9318_01069 [Streptococcus urinalis FB127-CNA-2]VEF31124.1 signal peptide [Streptococcus urinalis]
MVIMGFLITSFLMFFFMIVFMKILTQHKKESKETGYYYYPYMVTFKNGPTLDELKSNENLMAIVHEINYEAGTYVIFSRINDVKLKKLLMKEFNLDAKSVLVRSRTFIGVW